nr:hypothetical protein [Paenibacillus jamilae]
MRHSVAVHATRTLTTGVIEVRFIGCLERQFGTISAPLGLPRRTLQRSTSRTAC